MGVRSDTAALWLMRKPLGDARLVRRVLAHHGVVGALMGWYLYAAAGGNASGVFFVASYMVRSPPPPDPGRGGVR